jgi:hypothetical protein
MYLKKILSKNPDPECYNNEIKRQKAMVTKIYNKKIGQPYEVEPRRLSKQLLVALTL